MTRARLIQTDMPGMSKGEVIMGTAGKVASPSRSDVLREVGETLGLVPDWIKQIPDASLGGFWG